MFCCAFLVANLGLSSDFYEDFYVGDVNLLMLLLCEQSVVVELFFWWNFTTEKYPENGMKKRLLL